MINPLSIVPTWAYWVVIAGLTAALGVQEVRLASGRTALAEAQSAYEQENAARTTLALDHEVKIGKLNAQHAADQQQKDETYATKIHDLQATGAANRADAQRLRSRLATFTSSDRQPGETDAAACQRARDRLPRVGDLLAEGVELEAESRAIIQRRDAEVGRLLDQIRIDRVACSVN